MVDKCQSSFVRLRILYGIIASVNLCTKCFVNILLLNLKNICLMRLSIIHCFQLIKYPWLLLMICSACESSDTESAFTRCMPLPWEHELNVYSADCILPAKREPDDRYQHKRHGSFKEPQRWVLGCNWEMANIPWQSPAHSRSFWRCH